MGKKQIFLKGAIILATANVLVKLIGALYTIPLARLIGAEGMGLYGSAYQIYMWLFIVSTTGLPIAVSKLVSEEMVSGNYKEAHRIFKISLFLLCFIGILSSLILFSFARAIVILIGAPKAYLCVLAISPCLFFVAVMSAFRGYFQGLQNMVPTAVSELLEAIIKALLGLFFAYLLFGMGLEYSSSGAVLGATLGGFGGMISLCIIYLFYIRKNKKTIKHLSTGKHKQQAGKIIKNLVNIAVPITLGASLFSIANIIDLVMIMRRLREIGFSEVYATKLYGYLTGFAYKIYSLPITIMIALAISIVPVIAAAYINNNPKSVRNITETGLRVAAIFSIPAGIGIGILSSPILRLLFNDPGASKMLRILSFSIMFVSMVQVSGAVLQGIGQVMVPVKNLAIGAFIKVILNFILVGIPCINILGAPISTTVCYGVVMLLNLYKLKQIIKIKYKVTELLIKPLCSASIMGLGIIYFYNNMMLLWGKNLIATLTSIFIGFIIYFISMIAMGGIRREDIEMLPWGDKLSKYLFNLRIIRQ